MQINSYGTIYRYQMRNMEGSATISGESGGLSEVMQNLSQDQRLELREQMSLLNHGDRRNAIEQMSQIDSTTMSQEEYYKMLTDIVNRQVPPTTTVQSLFSIYA